MTLFITPVLYRVFQEMVSRFFQHLLLELDEVLVCDVEGEMLPT